MKNVRVPENMHARAQALVGCKVDALGLPWVYATLSWRRRGTLRSATAAVAAALEIGLEELERRRDNPKPPADPSERTKRLDRYDRSTG
jgi:hypothetical protein